MSIKRTTIIRYCQDTDSKPNSILFAIVACTYAQSSEDFAFQLWDQGQGNDQPGLEFEKFGSREWCIAEFDHWRNQTGAYAPTVTVRENEDGEFELPTLGATSLEAGLYFADDKQDAIDTAKHSYGENVIVTFKRGTYQEVEA